jgi:hypothetical protein
MSKNTYQMFNIISQQVNAHGKDIEIPSHSSQSGNHQGNKQQHILERI